MKKLYDHSGNFLQDMPVDFPVGWRGNYEVREANPLPEIVRVNRRDLEDMFRTLIRADRKIYAIKMARVVTDNALGLKEAKDYIESL